MDGGLSCMINDEKCFLFWGFYKTFEDNTFCSETLPLLHPKFLANMLFSKLKQKV